MAGGGGVVRWLPRWLIFFQGLPKISQGVRRSWAAGTQCWAVSTALCWGGGGVSVRFVEAPCWQGRLCPGSATFE